MAVVVASGRGARNKLAETWVNLVDFACEYGKRYAIGKGQGEVMKTCAGVLLVGALALAGTARATDKIDCANPADTADENQCADMDFQKADKELNAVWPKVKAWAEQSDMDSDSGEKHYYADTLLSAQRSWLAYRDAECPMASRVLDGRGGGGPEHAGLAPDPAGEAGQ